MSDDPSDSPAPHRCPSCGVSSTNKFAPTGCRCCAADDHPGNIALGADTEESRFIMPPSPCWPRLARNPTRLEMTRILRPDGTEMKVGLWWSYKGNRWIVQHPMEFPVYRIHGF